MSQKLNRIGIADDDLSEMELLSVIVEELDAEAVPLDGPLGDRTEALERIRDLEIDALIIDHHLKRSSYSSSNGAEICSDLYRSEISFVLVSSFVEQDNDVSIRAHRRRIPSLLEKSFEDPEILHQALNVCWEEQNNVFIPQRTPRRALFRILRKEQEAQVPVVDVEIPAWKQNSAVRIPLSLINKEHWALAEPDSRWLADINLGSTSHQDLYFDNIQPAPEPVADDFL